MLHSKRVFKTWSDVEWVVATALLFVLASSIEAQRVFPPNSPTCYGSGEGRLTAEECKLSLQTLLSSSPKQTAYLKAISSDTFDNFSYSIAISGGTIVVGAPHEDSSYGGVNADPTDNRASNSGAAYVFAQHADRWRLQAYLKAPDPRPGAEFGTSVAISGNTIVVGSAHSSIGQDGTISGTPNSGTAFVFVRDGSQWRQQDVLKASNPDGGDEFGFSVAVFHNTIAVGARLESSASAGINGDPLDNSKQDAGAVYVFESTGQAWNQEAYIKASNPDGVGLPQIFGDRFGSSIALDRNCLAVGAPFEASSAVGVNGNEQDNSLLLAGACYLFERGPSGWQQEAYLKASNTAQGGQFGAAVALSNKTLVVGSEFESGAGIGVNGDQSNTGPARSGAAYLFVHNGSTWIQEAYLKASNPDENDRFGTDVAIAGERIAVGANLEGAIALASGATYVFERDGATWSQSDLLKASNAGEEDLFGLTLAMSRNQLVVGAAGEWSDANLVNGDEHDDSAEEAGAAYVFDFVPDLLSSDTSSIPVGAGGQLVLNLDAGSEHACWAYVVVGSASGASPGLSAGGGLVIPINPDPYFWLTRSKRFAQSGERAVGVFDDQGRATVTLQIPRYPGGFTAGATLHHAFYAFDGASGMSLVSNAVPLALVK